MVSLVVSTLVLTASSAFRVVMLIPMSEFDKTVPVPEDPFRHTNDFTAVTFSGIVAVHTILKLLCDTAFRIDIVDGSMFTLNSSSAYRYII